MAQSLALRDELNVAPVHPLCATKGKDNFLLRTSSYPALPYDVVSACAPLFSKLRTGASLATHKMASDGCHEVAWKGQAFPYLMHRPDTRSHNYGEAKAEGSADAAFAGPTAASSDVQIRVRLLLHFVRLFEVQHQDGLQNLCHLDVSIHNTHCMDRWHSLRIMHTPLQLAAFHSVPLLQQHTCSSRCCGT